MGLQNWKCEERRETPNEAERARAYTISSAPARSAKSNVRNRGQKMSIIRGAQWLSKRKTKARPEEILTDLQSPPPWVGQPGSRTTGSDDSNLSTHPVTYNCHFRWEEGGGSYNLYMEESVADLCVAKNFMHK